MNNEIERPLDLLNYLKEKNVIVRIKGQENLIMGRLIAFDIHINLVLYTTQLEFIKGDNIISVC